MEIVTLEEFGAYVQQCIGVTRKNPSEDFRYLGPFYRGVRQKAEEVRRLKQRRAENGR